MRAAHASALIALLAYPAIALSETGACAANPGIVDACFEVRGRLSFWNGTPSARIWRTGTTRMLGIHGDVLPSALVSRRTNFDTEIWGTFSVCPFTRQKASHMQMVCVESWRDVAVRERRDPPAPKAQ